MTASCILGSSIRTLPALRRFLYTSGLLIFASKIPLRQRPPSSCSTWKDLQPRADHLAPADFPYVSGGRCRTLLPCVAGTRPDVSQAKVARTARAPQARGV